METKEQKYYTKDALKKRGWTGSLMKKFLPEPDLVKDNPIFKCAAPMQLFDISKMQEIEQLEEFIEAKKKTEKRKLSAQKATETKTKKTEELVSKMEISVPFIEKEKLISLAVKSFNNWQDYKEANYRNYEPCYATEDAEESFLNRISVNYLRHRASKYEKCLDDIFGKVGKFDAYFSIREKVFAEIKKNFPWLAKECDRQEGIENEEGNIDAEPKK